MKGRKNTHDFWYIGHDTETGEEYGQCQHCNKTISNHATNFKGEPRTYIEFTEYGGAPARPYKRGGYVVPKTEIEQRFTEGKIKVC
jgi:hypothetical protein